MRQLQLVQVSSGGSDSLAGINRNVWDGITCYSYSNCMGHYGVFQLIKALQMCKVSSAMIQVVHHHAGGHGFSTKSIQSMCCEYNHRWEAMHHWMVC